QILRQADMLVLPGSTASGYTASKLFPYILARRPMLAVFASNSSTVSILEEIDAATPVTFDARVSDRDDALRDRVYERWCRILERLPYTPPTNWRAFQPYTA